MIHERCGYSLLQLVGLSIARPSIFLVVDAPLEVATNIRPGNVVHRIVINQILTAATSGCVIFFGPETNIPASDSRGSTAR